MLRSTGVALVLASAVLLGQTPPADAPSQQDFDLAGEIMSPYCPGRTLAACPSSAAAELRMEVALRLSTGESRDAIVEALVGRFGEEIRGAPRPTGFGLLLWLWPPLLGGLLLVAVLAVGWRSRAGAEGGGGASTAALDAMHRRLDVELDEMD
jgi:cytochrome c-type biogenesis protein CcmH/NrfF